MAICLIRCCIWGQNFQCFRNDGNSLGCQTELNKLIYRPDRYMYVCHLYVIYIYMYVCTRYSHVKPAAKLLQNWPKFMEGNELTANVRAAIDGAVQCQAERVPKLISKPTSHLALLSPCSPGPLALQFSVLFLFLCLDIEQVVLGRVNWFL